MQRIGERMLGLRESSHHLLLTSLGGFKLAMASQQELDGFFDIHAPILACHYRDLPVYPMGADASQAATIMFSKYFFAPLRDAFFRSPHCTAIVAVLLAAPSIVTTSGKALPLTPSGTCTLT